MQIPSNIIDLVHKLAAITIDNGSTPSEVAKAAEVLAKVLATHQLSIADIPNRKVGENVVTKDYATGYKKKIPEAYSIYANCIATAWRCRCIRAKNIFKFVGFESDVALAEFFFDSTWAKVRRKGLTEAKSTGLHGREATKYAEDFAIGAASAVRERMTRFDPEEASTNALVCLKKQQVQDYVSDNFRLSGGRSNRRINNSAFDAGKTYGNNLDIHAGIQGKSRNTLALT